MTVLIFACAALYPRALVVLVLALVGWRSLARPVLGGASGPALIPVLRDTGFFEIAYAVVLGAGLVL